MHGEIIHVLRCFGLNWTLLWVVELAQQASVKDVRVWFPVIPAWAPATPLDQEFTLAGRSLAHIQDGFDLIDAFQRRAN